MSYGREESTDLIPFSHPAMSRVNCSVELLPILGPGCWPFSRIARSGRAICPPGGGCVRRVLWYADGQSHRARNSTVSVGEDRRMKMVLKRVLRWDRRTEAEKLA